MNMNKIIAFIMLVMCLSNVSAQEITVDKVEQNGVRFIFCSEINPNKMFDKVKIFPFLGAFKTKEGEEIYSLMIRIPSSVPISMNKDAMLLLKTGKDEVIQLHSENECEDKIGRYLEAFKRLEYEITPTYVISEEDLAKFKDGIKKIRFETVLKVYDKEFKSDKMGSAILYEYDLIKKAFEKKADIMDGF